MVDFKRYSRQRRRPGNKNLAVFLGLLMLLLLVYGLIMYYMESNENPLPEDEHIDVIFPEDTTTSE